MTISLVDHYIHQNLPSWARHLCLFMDNGTTNKNQFIIQWAMELVENSGYETIRLCFFVPGHGKNDVDRRIEQISHAFDNNDVFVTNQLVTLIQDTLCETGTCIQASHRDIVSLQNLLGFKYTSLKDIKSYRDFLVKRNAIRKIMVYYKECCYTGDYIHQALLTKNINEVLELRKESQKFTYEARGMSQDLSQDKVNDLSKMYDKFIEPGLRPSFIPISSTTTTSHVSSLSPS